MKNIKPLLTGILITVGLASCQVTNYGGIGGQVAGSPYFSGVSTSSNSNPFEKNRITTTAKSKLAFFQNNDFQVDYLYCYYKFQQAIEKGENLIVEECKEAYDLSKQLCFEKKNMLHCASTKNLSSEIFNDNRIENKAKKLLKEENPSLINFHLTINRGQVIVDYQKFFSDKSQSDNTELKLLEKKISSQKNIEYSIERKGYSKKLKRGYTYKKISIPLTEREKQKELDYIKKTLGFH